MNLRNHLAQPNGSASPGRSEKLAALKIGPMSAGPSLATVAEKALGSVSGMSSSISFSQKQQAVAEFQSPLSDRLHPHATLPVQPQEQATDTGSRIASIIDFMLAHLAEPLQVSTLVSIAGLSYSQFFCLFKKTTGFSPIDFFIRLRMLHACELLTGTDLQVKEVAARLGYDDPLYFSRRFKLVMGFSPKYYRAMKQAETSSPADGNVPETDSPFPKTWDLERFPSLRRVRLVMTAA